MVRGIIESKTCLLPMVTDESRFMLRMYGHYTRNILPYEGGLLAQPNYFAEAMEILGAHDAANQREALERARRDNNKTSGLAGLKEAMQ